jgi:membrane fusion protein, multidrug efflux system
MDDLTQDVQRADAGLSRRADRPWKRWVGLAAGSLLLIGMAVGGIVYWLEARHFETTDDASVDAYTTQMASRVAGQVTRLLFADNQHVAAGDLLLLIDPRDFQAKLDQVRGQQASAEATLQQATAQVEAATATYHINQAELEASRQTVGGAKAQVRAAQAQVLAAQASLKQAEANTQAAELQLSYCTIRAPVAGLVTHRTVSAGNYVNPGQALFALVQDERWVTANFKETQLAGIRPGQDVDLSIDAIPSVRFHGKVDSFQGGTGSAFSVLPAENATGNYVKIVQRVPVKIVFDDARVKDYTLAPGMSVLPAVRVR